MDPMVRPASFCFLPLPDTVPCAGLGLALQYQGEARRWTFFMLQWLANRDWVD